MRVISVELENDKYRVWFEHNDITWFKYFQEDISPNALRDWLNSMIEDAYIRFRK